MIFEVRGGLGDEVHATATVREYKRARPQEVVRVFQPSRPKVWLHNPWLNWGETESAAPGERAGRLLLRMDTADEKGQRFVQGQPVHRHAQQLGFQAIEDQPEIWLTPEELAVDYIPEGRRERTIAFDVGAGWESKRWPVERWRTVIGALRDEGFDVVGIGSRDLCAGEGGIPLTRNFFGQTDERELAVLLSQCALFLGHDSGPMHVAAAVGTPQVIIFGRTKWFNYAYHNTTSVFPYSECGENCYRQCYRPPKVEGKFSHCIEEIPVERVLGSVRLAARRYAYRPSELRPETRTVVPRKAWVERQEKLVAARKARAVP